MSYEDSLSKAAEEWFSVDFWFDLFSVLQWQYERAEQLAVLLLSLREMIEEEGEAGRKVASQAIQNAIQAAARYGRGQLLAEELERRAERNGNQSTNSRKAFPWPDPDDDDNKKPN